MLRECIPSTVALSTPASGWTQVCSNPSSAYYFIYSFSSPAFEQDHNAQWGRFYEAKDVVVEWHGTFSAITFWAESLTFLAVPSADEISFVMDILNRIGKPALDKVEALLATTTKWDGADRNDFCRYLHACRSIWSGLPTIYQEQQKDIAKPLIREDVEIAELVVEHLDVRAGFTLTDPADPRYKAVLAHRLRFGDVVQRAAFALRQNTGGEDHIDAVMGVARSIDVFLLSYAMTRGAIDALHKNYTQARESVASLSPVPCSEIYLHRLKHESHMVAAERQLAASVHQARAGVPLQPTVHAWPLPPPFGPR